MKCYEYYAVFNYAIDGISISFPDLPGCISCGYSTKEAFKMAKEALELYLEGLKAEEIPIARGRNQILLNEFEKSYLISIKI